MSDWVTSWVLSQKEQRAWTSMILLMFSPKDMATGELSCSKTNDEKELYFLLELH